MWTSQSVLRGRGSRGGRPPARGRLAGGVSLIVASLVAVTLAVPATAGATSKPKLIAEAKARMRSETAYDEAHHIIHFKKGAKFTVTCAFQGRNILCREHHGPERCINGHPWVLLSDEFPVIKGRVGLSLEYGLSESDIYCRGQ